MNTQNENILNNSVMYLKSVGPKRAESFAKVGIHNVRQLLFYFPTKYLDRTTILNMMKVQEYLADGYEGEVTVIASVIDKEIIRFGKKEMLKVHFRDASGFFDSIWFQGAKYFNMLFNPGEHYAISGKPALSKFGQIQFTHPDFDKITEDESQNFLNTGKIIPFYRVSKELKNTNIGDMSLRKIISGAVENYAGFLNESLPQDLVEEFKLLNIVEAVKNVHFPADKETLDKAITRFKFEELFYIEILVALRKSNIKNKLNGKSMSVKTRLVPDFLKTLPFVLTRAQLSVLSEIRRDMESIKPMNRLLQGDVGSGKTIVALIAMLIAKDNGFQSVLMAPTEILADQHYKNISSLLENFNINIALLIGGQKKSEKKLNLKNIEMQNSDIIIGTHALFEENVIFNNLGLIIIDEQHRFGVVQRSRLINKSFSPHVMVMTATPIPRTLSMTVYGDLDISTIKELPRNRVPVITLLRGENRLPLIYKFIVDKCSEGYQSFIIYPLVKESEKLELKAAETHFEELKEHYLKDLRIGMVHGQMSWQQKEEIMNLFAQKQFDVLIATTVIEVGIDIPDANIIVINDAHRFGLSQLHQLRGRIGRGSKQGYCILITKDEFAEKNDQLRLNFEYFSPSDMEKNKAAARLQSMLKYSSGFELSEIDLKLRGPGDIFGTKQSGLPELKFADIVNDTELLIEAKAAAFKLIEHDPHLNLPAGKIIRNILLENYKDNLNYAKIG